MMTIHEPVITPTRAVPEFTVPSATRQPTPEKI